MIVTVLAVAGGMIVGGIVGGPIGLAVPVDGADDLGIGQGFNMLGGAVAGGAIGGLAGAALAG